MLEISKKIFGKIKTKNNNIKEVDSSISFDNIQKSLPIEENENIVKDKEIKEEVKEYVHNIVRARLNAYVIKNKEEDFRLMDYDMDTGEVLWIEGKLFNNLRGLERVRWSPSSGSSIVYYGYISVEESGDKLVSSVYIMNIICDMIKNNSLGNIVYNIKKGTITINYKNIFSNEPKVFYIYGVSSVVEMEMLLNKKGLILNREY